MTTTVILPTCISRDDALKYLIAIKYRYRYKDKYKYICLQTSNCQICCASARRKAPASHPSTQKIIPRPFVRSSRIDATRRQYINVLKLKTNCKNVINRITKYYLSVILFFRETFPKACSCGLAKGINRHIFGVIFFVNLWPSEAGRLM